MSSSGSPEVSVVMGVHNAATTVAASLESVLNQSGVSLECIVVDDGCDDETPRVLAGIAARDSRVRVLTQSHRGLTHALIAGCEAARAPFIARLDSGDLMLEGRLQCQLRSLLEDRNVAVLASACVLCGPAGEHLSDPQPDTAEVELTSRMVDPQSPRLEGIVHPSVMFRREHYLRAGGYRSEFALAQDVDLWGRMARLGRVVRSGRVLTEQRVGLNSLSPRHHRSQQRLRHIAEAAAAARANGEDETRWLQTAMRLSAQALARPGQGDDWRAAYFVASCLGRRGDLAGARRYYREASSRSPLALRPRLRLAMMTMRRR